MQNKPPLPLQHLNTYSRVYSRAWKMAEGFRADRGKGLPDWPNWCFMPLAAWYAIVCKHAGVERLPPEHVVEVGRLGALGAWRYSQGVYRFHQALGQALEQTELSGEIPAEVLLRLPEWCLYIETPGQTCFNFPLHGFFAHLEYDTNNSRRELRLLLDLDFDGQSFMLPVPLHIDSGTLADAINSSNIEAQAQSTLAGKVTSVPQKKHAQAQAGQMAPLIAQLLYLCADEPEISDAKGSSAKPQRPRPKRVKGGWRLFPAAGLRIWDIGQELGQALERVGSEHSPTTEDSDKERKSPRPHLRRAHWHGFWSGPKTGQRRYKYKWLPPILVDPDREDL